MAWESGIAGRCEVSEDGYEEQILIPKEERDLAAKEGISTENKQKVTVQIMNLNTGESYTGRLTITGNQQTRLPQLIVVQLAIRQFTQKHRGFFFGMGTRHSGQVYLPTEIQEMLKESGKIRIQILGG